MVLFIIEMLCRHPPLCKWTAFSGFSGGAGRIFPLPKDGEIFLRKGSEFLMKTKCNRLLMLLVVSLLVAAVLGVSALAAQAEPAGELVCYEHGDMNADGTVDGQDAIYALFHSFGDLFGDQFPVEQSCDLDGDGDEDGDDAVYLLFASFGDLFGDQFPLKGTIHNYYDPIWVWDAAGTTARMELKCACGQPHSVTEGITVTAGQKTDATCVATGWQSFTAKVTFDGKDYENTLTVTIPANGNGHTIVGQPTCEDGVKCQNCDYELPALGHSFADNGEKVEGCKHIKLYKCGTCQKEIEGTAQGDVYYTHSFTAELKEEATCTKAGKKLLTCSVCQATDEETIDIDPAFHVWGEGVKANGVTTYTCACGQTKTVKEVAKDEAVSTESLKDNEVQLEGGAAVALDEKTVENLDTTKTVVISVDEVHKDDTNLDAAGKQQVGDSKIYDFSMKYSDGTPITAFEGEVTVALPYTLQEGDDLNAIDVWYIADDGSVECVKGVYNNGFVTFKTSHFSYYTVTRLTPAQRCAVYGCVTVTQTKKATCTADGYTKVFCQRCGDVKKNDIEAMTGHQFVKDTDRSTDATCAAPGRTLSVCSLCKQERIEDLKQLDHQYELTKTVAPSCTVKGYELHTCKLCQAEKTENEQQAYGHDYQEAESGWTWADDNSKATVTLVCSHDAEHTKVLTAVITKEMADSVCVGGTVTYTAAASLNKVTYTKTVTGTAEGLGHQPDATWTTDDQQHYHVCTVCGGKVGAAEHDWKRTVTQAATCSKAGKATDKCAVCDEEKEVTLPATGQHNFVNGKCSACGYIQGQCDHKKLSTSRIELSGFGVCDGYVIVMSCDCGQVRYADDWSFGCDFEEDGEETENGMRYTATCKTCGFVLEGEQYRVIDKNACTSMYGERRVMTKGNTQILSYDHVYEASLSYHPLAEEQTTVDLTAYGLCGGKLVTRTCYCGARSQSNLQEGACNWSYDETSDMPKCTVCGTSLNEKYGRQQKGCWEYEIYENSYSRNGQVVYSFTNTWIYENHDYRTTSYELYGESCTDGGYVVRTCATCGDTKEQSIRQHSTVNRQIIDTSASGLCNEGIAVDTCLCGAVSDYTFLYAQDASGHEWHDHSYSNGVETMRCSQCGFTHTIKYTEGEKDKNCVLTTTMEHSLTDGKGKTVTFVTKYLDERHNFNVSFVLAGQSCEDGVVATMCCADCGHSRKEEYDYHQTFEAEHYDLSEHGFCGEVITLYRCACGEYEHREISGQGCDWEWVAGDENVEVRRCRQCGIEWTQETQKVTTDSVCQRLFLHTHTYRKGEVTLCTVQERESWFSHDYTYQLTLLPGASTCQEGYSYIRTCVHCGLQEEGEGFGCRARPVERTVVSTADMCGQLQKITYRCACGQEGWISAEWADGEKTCCYTGSYDNQTGTWINICEVCGSKLTEQYSSKPVEGSACEYEHTNILSYYDPNGNLLVTEEYGEVSYSHTWLYSYKLLGATCADGWTCILQCMDCGEVSDCSDQVFFGCENNLVERTVAYDNDAICGPMYTCFYSCACGAEQNKTVVADACVMDWVNGDRICSTCGLSHRWTSERQRIIGTCMQNVTRTDTLTLNGQTVATVENSWQDTNHEILATFQLLGDSCQDGYYVYFKCAFCDYGYQENDSPNYEIDNSWRTEYIPLYDLGLCGGYIEQYSCPCGKHFKSVQYNNGCNFKFIDEIDGVSQYYCDTCKTSRFVTETGVRDPETCMFDGQISIKLVRDDKTVLDFVGQELYEQHDDEVHRAELRPGSETCEDGITLYYRCVDCGRERTSSASWHYKYAVSSEDLSQYGSVCGASLKLMQCACGAERGYEFSDDSQCDMDRTYTADFVEGSLNKTYYTTESWQQVYCESYLFTCAVTDPACGLKVRMSRYWINENCTAVEYETWQLGYDEETGTCLKELTVATGDRKGYHPYVQTDVDKTLEDGTKVTGTDYTCPDCGSNYQYLWYSVDGKNTKQTYEAVNKLDNGERKSWYHENTYVYFDEYEYNAGHYDQFVRADGSEYWTRTEYTYDFTDGCYRTVVRTDANGGYETETGETGHRCSWTQEWIQQPTCTQWGSFIEYEICQRCHKTVAQHDAKVEPYGHSWVWSTNKQTYMCSRCGLENSNAASGSIVMEDMSTDNDYVIGYWKRTEDSFNPYVSLVLYDAQEGQNDELVLTGIDFTYLTEEEDGVCALRFSKAAVAEAAAAAIRAAQYTGSYAVRISFVPVNGDATLDYAITFDALTAE